MEHRKLHETSVWNVNGQFPHLFLPASYSTSRSDPVITPEMFVQTLRVVEDYALPSIYHIMITKSIQEQVNISKRTLPA
ncbi:hypothetical protein HD554DRAFT_2029812 [Boletus coccyginus]|nr:hypothetical protein HD554DRAFT_2029812 [Boletus coccyginus]